MKPSPRFKKIKEDILSEPVHLCIERALLVTDFYKKHADKKDSTVVSKAKAFRYLMQNKEIRIFPGERIVGNMGRFRKSALIQPELLGVFASTELLWIEKRKTTPFEISWADKFTLVQKVIPFWLMKNMIVKAFWPHMIKFGRYIADQLNPNYYLINEAGGIGHFIPDYAQVINIGLKGYLKKLEGISGKLAQAMRITVEALEAYSKRLSAALEDQACQESDLERKRELLELSSICNKVPYHPAESFHEAVQSLWLCHSAVCLEGLNSAVSFGRIDQYLYPYYQQDLESGKLTAEEAKELLLCFSVKTTEHVFLISEKISQYHGGFLVAQAAIVGGVDEEGENAENDLSLLFLEVMNESGLRDPNYQVRIHKNSSKPFVERAVEVAKSGTGSPAFFNDEAIVDSLMKNGYTLEEARRYGIVGCVEPTVPGKSFCSTDAALVNLPVCLELALNCGRRFKSQRTRVGAKTTDPSSFRSINDLISAFEEQVRYMISRLISDIQILEKGNRDYHPTPFSSLLIDGCIESGKDVTAGGSLYKTSGIQGVGVADVTDSLAAIDEVVFMQHRYSLLEVIQAIKKDFEGYDVLRSYLLKASKFGNDQSGADAFASQVASIFHSALAGYQNTRGGAYISGFYSSTCHVGFGQQTGALPSGRKAKMPFAASMSAVNGMDRSGPTAVLNSVTTISPGLAPNGYALNLSFDPYTIHGEQGNLIMSSLVKGFFEKGGLELQFNVLDPAILEEALHHPEKHPGIVVRVAGYCAFFNDLPHEVKKEIIARNCQQV